MIKRPNNSLHPTRAARSQIGGVSASASSFLSELASSSPRVRVSSRLAPARTKEVVVLWRAFENRGGWWRCAVGEAQGWGLVSPESGGGAHGGWRAAPQLELGCQVLELGFTTARRGGLSGSGGGWRVLCSGPVAALACRRGGRGSSRRGHRLLAAGAGP